MYKMKLVYFNGRGLAETSRMILALGKQDYEDYRGLLGLWGFCRGSNPQILSPL